MIVRTISLFIISLCITTSFGVVAVPYSAIQPVSYVTDQAGVLDAPAESILEAQLTTMKASRNAEGAVVVVDNLDNRDIEGYSTALFRQFGIGEKGKNNGFLVLIAIEEKRSRIEVGTGMEGVLTDLRSGRMLDAARDNFRAGDYGGGLSEIITTADQLLAGDPETAQRLDNHPVSKLASWDIIMMLLIFSISFLPWFGSILGRSREWHTGGAIGALAGLVPGFIFDWVWTGVFSIIGLGLLGLLFDYVVSQDYKLKKNNGGPDWWAGGDHDYWFDSPSHGSSWGGFGGGTSGGGGASSSW